MKGPALLQHNFGSVARLKRLREDEEDFSSNFDWNRQSSLNSSNSSLNSSNSSLNSSNYCSSPEEVRPVKKFKTEELLKLQKEYEGSWNPSKARRGRCKRCHFCLRPDCGQCTNCLDKPKFGGPGTVLHAHSTTIIQQGHVLINDSLDLLWLPTMVWRQK